MEGIGPRERLQQWIAEIRGSSPLISFTQFTEKSERVVWGVLHLIAALVYIVALPVAFVGVLLAAYELGTFSDPTATQDAVFVILALLVVRGYVIKKFAEVFKNFLKLPAVHVWGASLFPLFAVDAQWQVTIASLAVFLFAGIRYWNYTEERSHSWWKIPGMGDIGVVWSRGTSGVEPTGWFETPELRVEGDVLQYAVDVLPTNKMLRSNY
ncbi:hypothetical protein [Natronorubrum sp. FCH18a]|uniref:hypothetical protein n=1 Tax=Natronorubrum sp. FCH18a TaxID=3447018 RepID=UPI003F515313